MDKSEFFKGVYGDGVGRVVIVLPNYAGKPVNDFWFSYPEDLDKMVEFSESKKTGDVWYSPIIFKSDSRTKSNSLSTQVLAADADSCDPNNFRVQPSITIQTSDGHWHVYWTLDKSIDAHEAAKVNRRIAQVHKDQGCDTAFVNAAKLLRVPETSNSKHPGAVVIVADVEKSLLSLTYLEEKYPASEIPDAIEATDTSTLPDDLEQWIADNRSSLLAGLPNSIGLRELLFGKFQPDKRSDVRYKLLCELYRMGMDDYGVMAIAWGAPSNKYNGDDPRGLSGLWTEAMKAKADVDFYDLPVDGEAPIETEQAERKKDRTNFLTEDEAEIVKHSANFIDEWIQWASTKTDAPAEYHRAAAITLLSTVYSEFGHATPKFAKDGLKLNIWFMVLGRSTKDRKTTSRSYMNAALRRLKNDDYNYSIGDDVTPGGISLALHDRANKSTVYDRDEVQGFFKEVLHQSYMSGGLEVFTKLYDGWSGGRVRASGDKKILESVPVSFIMFMMGILAEATDVLTVTNYRSGFLTRFVYVIGSRPDDYKSPPMEQDSEEDNGEDKVFDGLVTHLATNRNYWEMRGGDGKTYAMRADKDAWERLQQFANDVASAAEDTTYSEIIGTTSERMVISTLKLAALLAMDDRASTIKLPHMLQAIHYAGEWFDNSVTVASMVSESEWQRDVDKLEQFINSKGGKTTYAIAYRAFKDKRPFEFEEMLSALQSRGSLSRTQEGSRWILQINYGE